jgi:hypothetical protein
MLSNRDIEILLYYLDKGIQEEILRICDTPITPVSYSSLITADDTAFAQSLGITL